MLEAECRLVGVRIFTNVIVHSVENQAGFLVRAGQGEFRARALVVASGGLSIPKMGATPFGYDLARQFGLKIAEPRPALVPFLFNANDRQHYGELTGVSTEVVTSIAKQRFHEKMLFTHRGLSGPAILQISSYWRPGISVNIDLAPDRDLTEAIRNGSRRDHSALKAAFRATLPQRLADRWVDLHGSRCVVLA